MKFPGSGFSISLKNRLALSYLFAVFIVIVVLTILVNLFTEFFFSSMVRNKINAKSSEIASAVSLLYNPSLSRFDNAAVNTMGMYFAEEGYSIALIDNSGYSVCNFHSNSMHHMGGGMMGGRMMNGRMANGGMMGRMQGSTSMQTGMRIEEYPLNYRNVNIGILRIETPGSVFYNEDESNFLNSVNRVILIAGIVLAVLSIIISDMLSGAITKPILKAASAARRIAKAYSLNVIAKEENHIRINDRYQTIELAELTHSINVLAEKLEESELRQRQLTSDISHELRTPLACLQGNIEAMMDGVYASDAEHLESCREEIVRITALIEDLNTLGSFDWKNSVLDKTLFEISGLLKTTAEQWENKAAEKGIKIRLDLFEIFVKADYDRIKQVFVNLLSNAVKYTDNGTITISMKKENNGDLILSFADTGIGIPELDLPHIFERLYRSDKSRSRNTGGAGIGLSIAAAIISAHGWTIDAENVNTDGNSAVTGTLFRITVKN